MNFIVGFDRLFESFARRQNVLFNATVTSLALVLLFTSLSIADSRRYYINADDWARPRSGEVLIEFEALRELINDWSQTQNAAIEIYYPGGEMGGLWATELADWLVSLGVPAKQIEQRSGSGTVDRIELIIK